MEARMLATMDDAFQLFDRIGNRFFRATFIKRSDNSIRHMTARQRVRKGTKGVGLAYEPRAKGLLPVFDVHAHGFRMVAVEGLLSVRFAGQDYVAAWNKPEIATTPGRGLESFLSMMDALRP